MPSIYRLAAASVLVACLSSHAMSQAPAEAPPVPVSVVKVERRDMPIVASGIGTAQAWYSVLLRTQVDGKLIDIAVTDLPLPDSPTRPSVSPRSMRNETSLTAAASPPARTRNAVSACRSGAG